MKKWIHFEAVTTASVLFPFKMLEGSCRRKGKIQLWIAKKRAREIIAEQEHPGELFDAWEVKMVKPEPVDDDAPHPADQAEPKPRAATHARANTAKPKRKPVYTQLTFENILSG